MVKGGTMQTCRQLARVNEVNVLYAVSIIGEQRLELRMTFSVLLLAFKVKVTDTRGICNSSNMAADHVTMMAWCVFECLDTTRWELRSDVT